MSYIIVHTTISKLEIAEAITYKLLAENLAACIQIDKIVSYFKWEGKVDKIDEWRLSIKSTASHYDAISKSIKQMHTYKVPEIVELNISDGDETYLSWLKNSVN